MNGLPPSARMARVPKPRVAKPRVLIEVDMDLLGRLASIQCTQAECAAVLGVSLDTIKNRIKKATGAGYEDFYQRHADEGKVSLRRAQFKAALGASAVAATGDRPATKAVAPNIIMQIWLGKQVLNQKDRQETTGADGGPVEMMVTYRMTKAPRTDKSGGKP